MSKRSLMAGLLLIMFCIVFTVPAGAENNSEIKILINGRVVEFTDDTGYPYVDENNRTMVPLRVTMETAGFAVGYDPNARTAIVITNYNRIEIPIGTNKIYVNNELIENDTIAVAKDGRTYLPIRVVLENAGYTVEWDAATRTVNAYNFNYDENELIPYSTSNPATLINNILNGNVVYINGKYYATPDYVKRLVNAKITYLGDDLNTAIYPQERRDSLADFDESRVEWITGVLFDKILVNNNQLKPFGVEGEPSNIPGYSYIYAFYKQEGTGTNIIYPVNEMTDEFMNASDAAGTFNGIRMKKESGTLYFNYYDLKEKNIYSL
ncbi:MAG TPA: copper amine oxidase N-terminal domain-containing protein [Thermoclostridium sp.]